MGSRLPDIEVKDISIASSILDHWQELFQSTSTDDEPFQHFYCEKIWPDDVFDKLLKFMPPQELYRPLNINQWVNADGVSTRDKCYFSEMLDEMEPEAAEFWKQIVIVISSRKLKNLIFRKFARDVALRLGTDTDNVEGTNPRVAIGLTRDFEDYVLKPHTDGFPRIVTAQFYMPVDESQRDLGTTMYSQNGILQRLQKGRFTSVKRMPFLPNSGYAFAVNNHPDRKSYHGRELISKGSGERNSILVSWNSEERVKDPKLGGPEWQLNDLL